MQKFWTLIISGLIALPSQAQTMINIEAILACREINDPQKRLICYDQSMQTATAPRSENPSLSGGLAGGQSHQLEYVEVQGTFTSWANNENLPEATRLAAQILGSEQRTAVGDYPIAVVDSDTHEIIEPQPANLEEFMRGMSDDAMAAAKYKRDFYFAIPSSDKSTSTAILTIGCQKNITDFKVHYSKFFPKTEEEVIFSIANTQSGQVEDQTQRERFVGDPQGELFIMQMPRGLEGIRLIKWIATGDELQVQTERNGEIVTSRFNTKDIEAPLSILARQCSWN